MTFHRWAYSNDTEHCQTDKFGALGVISDRGEGVGWGGGEGGEVKHQNKLLQKSPIENIYKFWSDRVQTLNSCITWRSSSW